MKKILFFLPIGLVVLLLTSCCKEEEELTLSPQDKFVGFYDATYECGSSSYEKLLRIGYVEAEERFYGRMNNEIYDLKLSEDERALAGASRDRYIVLIYQDERTVSLADYSCQGCINGQCKGVAIRK